MAALGIDNVSIYVLQLSIMCSWYHCVQYVTVIKIFFIIINFYPLSF